MDLFAPHGAIKSTLWPASRKNNVFKKFYFSRTFVHIASYQILENDAILINHESFCQKKESAQLYPLQILEINSLVTETIKNNNIAIVESKIIYFCLRSNFRESTTLKAHFTL